jgi:hypothetical protein
VGFGAIDAVHLAFAEAAAARWFATTDDRLLQRARRESARLRVDVVTPDEIRLDVSRGEP